MHKISLVFGVFCLLFASCKDCKKDNTGEFTFNNGTSKNIAVVVDGFQPFTVYATGKKAYTYPAGIYDYGAITTDSLFYWTGKIEVKECEARSVELIL